MADGGRIQPNGKPDAHGIFTMFLAWGFPATRSWSLILTLFDVPPTPTIISIFIKRKGDSKLTLISQVPIEDSNIGNSHTVQVGLGYEFKKEGDYELICSLKNHTTKLKIPMRLRFMLWPTFTEKELSLIRSNSSSIISKLSVHIKCKDCGHLYVFEENVLPEENVSGGAIRFPENGIYLCKECSGSLKLKDMQGQMRTAIKESLMLHLKSSKNV